MNREDHARWDWVSPICILILAISGVFFIYSAQLNSIYSNWTEQIIWIFLGAFVYLFVSFIDYDIYMKYGHWLYILTLILLVAVLIPGIGLKIDGARRWLDLGLLNYQPSELAKISVMLIVSSILARSEIGKITESLTALVKVALVVLFPMVVILAQPDLGTSLVLIPMVLGLLYVSNLSMRFFTTVFLGCVFVIGAVTWDVNRYANFLEENNYTPTNHNRAYEEHSYLPYLRDYQRNRILTFLMPEKVDPKGSGWNLNQSLISVGSGGLTGKGWTEGTQAKLGYLPRSVAHNDFIFSVLAEEKGFLGSLTVLSLTGILLLNGVRIASKARDRFGMFLAVGVTIIFAIHALVNIGMTIGMMPITGLPLPFLSYGGSFLLSCCILQGIVQSVYRHRKAF
ncbi:rod shape-determining protein RodA [Opitutia bacterium ISCC 51]|nr:rod shape-determining protein RodA [Opitutae bacterium ISCC 51]QXD30470.1 rod shape-determining protein RodA [Opitutae bacterium ISCC 52]